MTLEERFKAQQERRLILLLQREQVTAQITQAHAALAAIDREAFACDGAMAVLQELITAQKEGA